MKSLAIVCLAWVLVAPATQADAKEPKREHKLDLSLRRGESPEMVRGPVTLQLDKLNRVRYRAIIGQQVTLLDGPDLSLAGFIPKLTKPAAAAPATAPPAAKTSASTAGAADFIPPPSACPPPPEITGFDTRLQALSHCLEVERLRVDALHTNAERARTTLNARRESVLRLVSESDQLILAGNGGSVLASQVRLERSGIAQDLAAARRDLPDPKQVTQRRAAIGALAVELADLPRADPDASWRKWIDETPNYLEYSRVRQASADLLASLAELAPGSDFVEAVDRLTTDLEGWQRELAGLEDAAAYEIRIPVYCGYPFFREKKTEYTLTLIDRTITDPAKNRAVEKLVTVVCPSNVTVSAGIAAANVAERDFGFVSSRPDDPAAPDAPALVNRIALLNESDDQINPVALISTRLADWKGAEYGLHLTTGAVADYDNPDGGMRFGYLLGLSVSFKDQLLLTTGIQGIRVPELAGGFALGDVQPAGLAKVPMTNDWQFGWTLGLTYAIGGGG